MNLINGVSNVCLICHDNREEQIRSRLTHLINILKTYVKNENNFQNDYNWNINIRCKYGISHCSKHNTGQLRLLTEQAGGLLNAFVENGDKTQAWKILQLLTGYFPSVYNDFKRRVETK